MRMEQLEYLAEISRNRSLNAAAQKLHISQQALSISIKSLEEELGFDVLYRSYQGVALTPKGAQLVKMTVNFLDKVERLRSSTPRTSHPLRGALTIHSCYTGEIFFIPRLKRMLLEEAPELALSVSYASTHSLMAEVACERLALAFGLQLTVREQPLYPLLAGLTFTPLCHHKLYCRVPRIYPLAAHQSTSIKNLLSYPLIFYSALPDDADYSFFQIVNQFGEPRKPMITSDIYFCREMVDAGNFIELFIDVPNQNPYFNLSRNCVTLAISDDIQIAYGCLCRGVPSDPQEQALWDYITENLPRLLEP